MITLKEINNTIYELLIKNLGLFDPFESVYLFGSAITEPIFYNDIDILIIYSNYTPDIECALKSMLNKIEGETEVSIDLTVLSIEEEQEVKFIERIAPYYLKIK